MSGNPNHDDIGRFSSGPDGSQEPAKTKPKSSLVHLSHDTKVTIRHHKTQITDFRTALEVLQILNLTQQYDLAKKFAAWDGKGKFEIGTKNKPITVELR